MSEIQRALIMASVAVGIFTNAALAAPAAAPVTTEQFVERCKTDARFCRTRIIAAEVLLEKSRKACLPGSVSKDAMAAKVADVIADVLEEDPDTFRSAPYRPAVNQIISFLWPCEPISQHQLHPPLEGRGIAFGL